jgi:hypothetical protein
MKNEIDRTSADRSTIEDLKAEVNVALTFLENFED